MRQVSREILNSNLHNIGVAVGVSFDASTRIVVEVDDNVLVGVADIDLAIIVVSSRYPSVTITGSVDVTIWE